MKGFVIFFCIIALGFISISHEAQSIKGDQLLSKLTGQTTSEVDQALNLINSMGYVQGFLDSYIALVATKPCAYFICLPEEGMSVEYCASIIATWLKKHPNQLDNTARTLIYRALGEYFPCPRTIKDLLYEEN